MTCMLWDIETGSRNVEFSDHTGDVMRWVSGCYEALSVLISPQPVIGPGPQLICLGRM
jgi:hypothetical protein